MRAYFPTLVVCVLLLAAAPLRSAEDPNSLIGVIAEAPASSKWVGSEITFTGLVSAQPSVVWPDGYDERLSKVFENENLLVLQFVGAVGSTDTVYIEKKNKRFLVVSVGAMSIVVNKNSTTVSLYRGSIK